MNRATAFRVTGIGSSVLDAGVHAVKRLATPITDAARAQFARGRP
jgi:hypothetical protein